MENQTHHRLTEEHERTPGPITRLPPVIEKLGADSVFSFFSFAHYLNYCHTQVVTTQKLDLEIALNRTFQSPEA